MDDLDSAKALVFGFSAYTCQVRGIWMAGELQGDVVETIRKHAEQMSPFLCLTPAQSVLWMKLLPDESLIWGVGPGLLMRVGAETITALEIIEGGADEDITLSKLAVVLGDICDKLTNP
ncbi:hypothetical protein [Paraburkholderia sp. GAS32]|uniref:hypothetical protein n=1 Tax=Paraburkholderia sp. GAS32 TaxID=3035129 RepID=UPI003D1E8413